MRRLFVVAAAVALSACSATASLSDGDRYVAAVKDAAWASPDKVLPLRPLPDGDSVTVVSWTGSRDPLACADGNCPVPRAGATRDTDRTWVTLAGEVRDRCKAWGLSGAALTRRLERVLGLPPGGKYPRVFVEFSVPRAALARPCVGQGQDAQGRPVCTPALTGTLAAADATQTFAALTMASSYTTVGGYPYTRLGYTYDWAPDARADHYGASELVVLPATPATIRGQWDSDAYCR